MTQTITRKTKRKAKKRSKDAKPIGTKEGGKLKPFVVGSYLTHNLSNVTSMQIMKFNSNRRYRTNISCQVIYDQNVALRNFYVLRNP